MYVTVLIYISKIFSFTKNIRKLPQKNMVFLKKIEVYHFLFFIEFLTALIVFKK